MFEHFYIIKYRIGNSYLYVCILLDCVFAAIQQEQEPHCIGPCEIAFGNRPCNEECTSQQYAYGFCDYQTKGEDNPQCCCYTS